MQDWRTAWLLHEGTGHGGTGCLVAPCLVLTALHVAVPDASTGGDRVCRVRLRGRDEERRGGLVWPNDPHDTAMRALDIALLELDAPFSAAANARATCGRLPSDRQKIKVRAMGHPAAVDDARGAARVLGFNGDLDTTGTDSDGLVPFRIPAGGGLPKKAEGWAGFSGTGVFAGEHLVGVVTDSQSGADGLLWVCPLERLMGDAQFWRLVAENDAPDLPLVPTELPRLPPLHGLDLLVHLVDRQPQSDAFDASINGVLSGAGSSPLVCLLGAPPEHEPDRLVTRFEDRNLRRLLEFLKAPRVSRGRTRTPALLRADHCARIAPVAWPEHEQDRERAQRILMNNLRNALDMDPWQPVSAPAIAKALADRSRPSFFVSFVRASRYGSHEWLLRNWLGFWGEVGDLAPKRLIVLFLGFLHDVPGQRPDEAVTAQDNRLTLDRLPPLTLIDWKEIESWLEREVARSNPRLRPHLPAVRMRLRALGLETEPCPLALFRGHIDEIIAGAAS